MTRKTSLFDALPAKYRREIEADVRKRLLPRLRDSAAVVALSPPEADLKMAIEIGFAMLLDKPLIVVIPEGRIPAERLVRAADQVVRMTNDEIRDPQAISAALNRLLNQ